MVLLYDLVCFYLRCRFACDALVLRNLRLLGICADLLLPAKAALLGLAAICALSIAVDYTAPKQDSRAAADNRSRGKSYSSSNAAPPRAGILIPEVPRSFEPETANQIPFSWGSKGDILFPRKENIPLDRPPCTVQGNKNQRCRAVNPQTIGSSISLVAYAFSDQSARAPARYS